MGSQDAGAVKCGGADRKADALPVHQVHVDGFWMDESEVTNDQFAEFVRATGYVTIAEQVPKAHEFPGVPSENPEYAEPALARKRVDGERPDGSGAWQPA